MTQRSDVQAFPPLAQLLADHGRPVDEHGPEAEQAYSKVLTARAGVNPEKRAALRERLRAATAA